MKSVVIASLNAKLQPIHRGELEDAFDDLMRRKGFGMRVVGGGTLQEESGEIAHCDIEIEIDELNDENVQLVVRALESMLAPKGSRLHIPAQDRVLDFGRHEGLALYINGTDLPPEVYANSDVNFVFQECDRLLEGAAFVNSHWEGPLETALYMYGKNFQDMYQRLLPLLENYPLCQKSRIVQIA
ncbi:hypothetical protein C7U60_06550 [Mesorhizobium plurifarium]|nr:hypothetical protein C7U60_06550 [Mesorhizobium plurifarium]